MKKGIYLIGAMMAILIGCGHAYNVKQVLKAYAYAGMVCPMPGTALVESYDDDGNLIGVLELDAKINPATGNHCYSTPAGTLFVIFRNAEGKIISGQVMELCLLMSEPDDDFEGMVKNWSGEMVCPPR